MQTRVLFATLGTPKQTCRGIWDDWCYVEITQHRLESSTMLQEERTFRPWLEGRWRECVGSIPGRDAVFGLKVYITKIGDLHHHPHDVTLPRVAKVMSVLTILLVP
jgi:hypothetical protein